jgi:hypothetical protein
MKACLLAICLVLLTSGAACAGMERIFVEPPPAAKPWTYWFWINGNISRHGITADLEALA